jgi:hypothetical protein
MSDKVIRCRFDFNHELFPGGFYEVRWFRADGRGKFVEITRERFQLRNHVWLPKRCPSARLRSSDGGRLPKRCPVGTRSSHAER